MDGSHPTPMQGQYQVLYLDFSRASGGNGSLAENFDRYCSMAMDVFGKVYEPYYFPGYAKKMEAQPDFVSKTKLPKIPFSQNTAPSSYHHR